MKEKDYITYKGQRHDIIDTDYGYVASESLENILQSDMEQGGELADTAVFTDELFVFYIPDEMMERYDKDEISVYVGLEIEGI